jgi:thiol-disulfide isomerase/thioredoxin
MIQGRKGARALLLGLVTALGLPVLILAAASRNALGSGGENETDPAKSTTLLDASHELVGGPAPAWDVTGWINSEPLTLDALRGKVVLVRFWTAPRCPYCRASSPALATFHETYAENGLAVVGFYHHKSRRQLADGDVSRYAETLGFSFPVAVDPGWRTLKNWWLDRIETSWTSVSFLIDRAGVIRAIHPGGQYVRGDGDYEALESAIQTLLAEAPPPLDSPPDR